MRVKIEWIKGRQVLDSRGRPTVEVDVGAGSYRGRFIVPSGASTGRFEAVELRDGDPDAYGGLSVMRAVDHVNQVIAPALIGRDVGEQRDLDRMLCEMDGTPNKARLGANAILGVSGAAAAAAALAAGRPLFQCLADLMDNDQLLLPMPMVNMLSGGLHAGRQIEVQDFLFVPQNTTSYPEAMERAYRVHKALRQVLEEAGYAAALVADEGGFGPPLAQSDEGLELLTRAIERAGLRPGESGAIAVDVAATHFFEDGGYRFGGEVIESGAMIDQLERWTRTFPVVSIEDGFWGGGCAGRDEVRRRRGDPT